MADEREFDQQSEWINGMADDVRRRHGIPDDVPDRLARDMILEADGYGTSEALAEARRAARYKRRFSGLTALLAIVVIMVIAGAVASSDHNDLASKIVIAGAIVLAVAILVRHDDR